MRLRIHRRSYNQACWSPSRMNDVGYRISNCKWGNDKAIQLMPNETSIGWWRVGTKNSPYGRFARGFELACGKNVMSCVLDTRLWGGLPFAAAAIVSLRLRLIYFDAGGGSLTIGYDSTSGCVNATTVAVGAANLTAAAMTGEGTWSEISLNLTDSYFNRRCGPRGADILLSSTADTIIHGFEIYAVATVAMAVTVSPTAVSPSASFSSGASPSITSTPLV